MTPDDYVYISRHKLDLREARLLGQSWGSLSRVNKDVGTNLFISNAMKGIYGSWFRDRIIRRLLEKINED